MCKQVAAPLPAQTNFMASYIHLDDHCPANLDELEAQDIDTHSLWQARAKKPALSRSDQ